MIKHLVQGIGHVRHHPILVQLVSTAFASLLQTDEFYESHLSGSGQGPHALILGPILPGCV